MSDVDNGDRVDERHIETSDVYKKVRRGELAKRVTIVIVLALFVCDQGLQLYTTLATRHQQVQSVASARANQSILHAVLAGNRQIKDCIDPHGKCAARSRAATAGVVGSINEVQIFAAACSAALSPGLTPPQALAAIRPCVTRLLKENQ